MKNTNTIIGIIIALLVVAGGSFYGGMIYGRTSLAAMRGGQFRNMNPEQQSKEGMQQFQPGGQMQRNGSRGNSGFTIGEVISKDDKSITVKLPDGGSKIIFYNASTSIGKTVDGLIEDVVVGENVIANGTSNSDGSITAQLIQLQPVNPTSTPSLPTPGSVQ